MKKQTVLIFVLVAVVTSFGLYAYYKEQQRVSSSADNAGLSTVDTSDLPNINDKTEVIDPAAQAQNRTPTFAFPPALLVEGKPVDPMCLSILGEDRAKLPLTGCRENFVVTEEKISPVDNPASVYARYRGKDEAVDAQAGFVQYRYIGPAQGGEAVLIHENGGGSGTFSVLLILERADDHFIVKQAVAAGDRCNGGVGDVSLSEGDGALGYAINMTPYDFLELAGKGSLIEPYKGLDNSAASCYAQAFYRDGLLVNITINETVLTDLRRQGKSDVVKGAAGNYQPCFDRMLSAWVSKNNKILTPAQLNDFVGTFEAACLRT